MLRRRQTFRMEVLRSTDISGGKVWEAAQQFREAGVPAELVQRLQQWGIAFTDRAARLQY